MAQRASAARVKSNRSYTVEQAADAVGVTQQTVRAWIKGGLPALSERRPTLILGFALKNFIAQKRDKAKRPLKDGELFCLTCKRPTTPAFGVLEYRPLSNRHGQVRGFCACCEGTCTRIIRGDDLQHWQALAAE